MKKFLLITLSSLMCAQAGFAIYPLDRTAREICDIVRSRELRQMLPPAESIIDVRRVPRGYIVTTNHFQVVVDVYYGPYGTQAGVESAEGEGAARFEFHEPTEQ